ARRLAYSPSYTCCKRTDAWCLMLVSSRSLWIEYQYSLRFLTPYGMIFRYAIQHERRRPMRADRLISLLLLLQTRGRMTAQELAGRLEVSERTIYRDVSALGMA